MCGRDTRAIVASTAARSSQWRRLRGGKAKKMLMEDNVSAIRPGHGLPPTYLDHVLEREATTDTRRGTPLTWDLVRGSRQ